MGRGLVVVVGRVGGCGRAQLDDWTGSEQTEFIGTETSFHFLINKQNKSPITESISDQ